MSMKEMQSRRAFRPLAGAAVMLLAITATGCAGDDDSVDVTDEDRYDLSGQHIRIGTAAETTLDIGTSYGIELLSSWGAEVEREELTDVSGLQGIIADRIDVSARSSDEVIDAQVRGVDLVAFGAPASSMHYVIIGDPEIEGIEDLSGRSVATSGPGGFDTNLFDALLSEEGMTRDGDVEEITIGGSSERTASVLAGQADVSMVFLDDWISLSEQTEDAELVAYVDELLPGLSARGFAATREWLDANEELALGLACANLEANRWIAEEEEEFVDLSTDRVSGTSPEAAEQFREEALGLDMYPHEPAEILNIEQYERTADVLEEGGVLDEEVDLSDSVDTSYLEQAAEDGCGAD